MDDTSSRVCRANRTGMDDTSERVCRANRTGMNDTSGRVCRANFYRDGRLYEELTLKGWMIRQEGLKN